MLTVRRVLNTMEQVFNDLLDLQAPKANSQSLENLRGKRLDYFRSRTNSKPVELEETGASDREAGVDSVHSPIKEGSTSPMESQLDAIDIEQTEFVNENSNKDATGLDLIELLKEGGGSESGSVSSSESDDQLDAQLKISINEPEESLDKGEVVVPAEENSNLSKNPHSYLDTESSEEEIERFDAAVNNQELRNGQSEEDVEESLTCISDREASTDEENQEQMEDESDLMTSSQEFEMLEKMVKAGVETSLDELDGVKKQKHNLEDSSANSKNWDEKISVSSLDDNNNPYTKESEIPSHLKMGQTETPKHLAPEGSLLASSKQKNQREGDDLLDLVGLSDNESTVSSDDTTKLDSASSSGTLDEEELNAMYRGKQHEGSVPMTKSYPSLPGLPSTKSSIEHAAIFVSNTVVVEVSISVTVSMINS